MPKRKFKMDPYLISNEDHELDYIVARFKAKGKFFKRADIRKAKKKVGDGRIAVYNYLKQNY